MGSAADSITKKIQFQADRHEKSRREHEVVNKSETNLLKSKSKKEPNEMRLAAFAVRMNEMEGKMKKLEVRVEKAETKAKKYRM